MSYLESQVRRTPLEPETTLKIRPGWQKVSYRLGQMLLGKG